MGKATELKGPAGNGQQGGMLNFLYGVSILFFNFFWSAVCLAQAILSLAHPLGPSPSTEALRISRFQAQTQVPVEFYKTWVYIHL